MEVLGPLLDIAFPARCVGCGAGPAALCPACLGRARPAPAGTADGGPPPGLDWWAAAFAYEGAVREALARVKYRNARSALPVLAAALVDRLRVAPAGPVDVVTWPPTTAARRRQRGFDQAEHLARAVGRALAVPVQPCLVRRGGEAQTGRSAGERRRGPVFAMRAGVGLRPRVLLVDDVATTGATLAAAARALRAGGAEVVGAATVARTPRRARPPPARIDRWGLKPFCAGAEIKVEAEVRSSESSSGGADERRDGTQTPFPGRSPRRGRPSPPAGGRRRLPAPGRRGRQPPGQCRHGPSGQQRPGGAPVTDAYTRAWPCAGLWLRRSVATEPVSRCQSQAKRPT